MTDLNNLALKAASGDEEALSELYEALEISKRLRKYHLSREDTEDIMQEIKETIYLSLAKYNQDVAPFISYALVIIRRAIKQHIDDVYDFNRKISIKEELLDFTEEVSLSYDETLKDLEEHLSPLEMEIVLYFVSYGYSASFIANKFKISVRKVYKTIAKFKKVAQDLKTTKGSL